jgi:hypothetical protein
MRALSHGACCRSGVSASAAATFLRKAPGRSLRARLPAVDAQRAGMGSLFITANSLRRMLTNGDAEVHTAAIPHTRPRVIWALDAGLARAILVARRSGL